MPEVQIDKATREEWRGLLAGFADANIYNAWDYAVTVHASQYVSRLVVREQGEAIAIAQVRIATTPVIARGIAYAAWGPLWRRKGLDADATAFEKAVGALVEEYGTKRGLVVRVAPAIFEGEAAETLEALTRAGFTRCHAERTYRTIALNVTGPPDAIRTGFASKWRNCLNRAEKNDLEIVAGTAEQLYEEFLAIYGRMRERKGFDPGADAGQWGTLQAALSDYERMTVILARSGGRAVAGAVFSFMGERAIYLFGATSEDGLKSQGSYALQWRAIQMMREAGCSVYDLGGIDPEENPGVYHFKAGLGGREASHTGMFEYCSSPLSRIVVNAGETLKRAKKAMKRKGG